MSHRTRSTSSSGRDSKGGVLSSLRRLIRTRRSLSRVSIRPRKSTAAATDEKNPLSLSTANATATPTRARFSTNSALQATHKSELTSGELAAAISQLMNVPLSSSSSMPTPPRDPEASESDENESSEEVQDNDEELNDSQDVKKDTTAKKGKKDKTKAKRKSTWVAKLLNQVGAAPKDRVHTHKKRKPRPIESSSEMCHEMLRVIKPLHAALLGHIFDYLQPLKPAQRCLTVNKALMDAVVQYYAKYCEWPRPRAYLAHHIFSSQLSGKTGVLSHILEMLSTADRVYSSAVSRAFLREADALPLEINGGVQASQFLRLLSPDRVEQRFPDTKIIRCVATEATDAVKLLQLMSEDAGDHFISVQVIELQRFRDSSSEGLFVQLVQSLFSDRISHSLQKLSLSDLKLEDPHYRQLARLFYDGHFPMLQSLDISRNLFSSRFMRDWARSFHEDRFSGLHSLDITAVGMSMEDISRFFACLRHVPKLRTLRISHNFCPLTGLQTLADVITERCLAELEELSCSAISSADHAMALLIDALASPGACISLRHLDLSGNDLSAGDHCMRSLARAFSSRRWPQLSLLNLSFTTPSHQAFQLWTRALRKCSQTTLREIHLGGNALQGDAFESLILAMEAKVLRSVELLNLSENGLEALEFELLSNCLTKHSCPRLRQLFLAGNAAKSTGITHFCRFFHSKVAERLHTLDLSGNAIPPSSLGSFADEFMNCNCQQLQILNVSRNLELRSVVRFQQLIRSNKCPSLACVQVGYAQSQSQGYDFVRTVRSRMSVEELRRLKQLKFEERMKKIEQDNIEKAARAAIRCKRQTRLLREMYDHMESQADRALRRRKRVRKSPHLHIHEEIARLKQDKYHDKIRRQLERAMTAPQTA